MIAVALVAIPLVGAGAVALLQPGRAGRWALAALLVEVAILLAGLSGAIARFSSQPLVVLGTELALRPPGMFAVLVASLVVLVAIAASGEELAPPGLLTAGLLGLSGVALVASTSANSVTAALAMLVVVAALAPALAADPAVPSTRPPAQRFVTMLALGVIALLLSGILDRFYGRQPGPGILGPVAALFVVGTGIAVAALPMSFWLPVLASEAPLGAGLAVGLLGSAMLSLLAGDLSANPWLLDDAAARMALTAAGGVAGAVSALLALGEKDPARCFAFLVSASADFALAGLATSVPADPTGAILTLGAQSLAGALGLTCLGATKGQVAGLFRRRPPLAAGLAVASLSLIGLPLTMGYVGRWLTAPNLAGQHLLLLTTMALASAIGGIAIWRAFGPIFDRPNASAEPWRPLDLVALAVAALLVLGGIVPGPLLGLLQ